MGRGIALGVGVIAAIVPAWRAYRTDVSRTLAGGEHEKALLAVLGIGLSAHLYAQAHGKKEEQQDAKRHRIMAAGTRPRPSGLEAGKGEKVCLEQLLKDCKGVGIGKYCGMKLPALRVS